MNEVNNRAMRIDYIEKTKNSRIKQNLDTNFLKLVAIITMLVDHIGKAFFPNQIIFTIIGRIAFPLFAYCIVVGCLYTSNFTKYLERLGIFAVVSQPFFVAAFHPTMEGFLQQILNVNIFFTLIAGVLTIRALMNFKKYGWLLLIVVAMELFLGLDYSFYGIIMMVLFYIGRNNSKLSFVLVFIWMTILHGLGNDISIGSVSVNTQFFAILALPFIYIHTTFNPRINKYFFYVFYPAHFFIIFLIRCI